MRVETRPSALRRDALLAFVLAAALGLAWTWRAWPDLLALRLPDTDDVMRLQQVRDWLGGQGWSDLAQHRLGDPATGGTAMHWTRLADLGPAALIVALAPLLGRHLAEVAAVTVWPPLLFAAALLLVGRVARALSGDVAAGGSGTVAATATVLAAIAYPATTIFAPGRIDHHGLQMVLLLAATLATVAPPGLRAGLAAGAAAAAGLTVGLETAPLLAVLGGASVAEWVRGGRGARLRGLGAGALAGLAAARALFAPAGWAIATCDALAAPLWRAALPLAGAVLLLGLAGPWFATRRSRLLAGIVVGGGATAVALWLSPACLHPYGGVDPLLSRLWLDRVGEAQPLFAAAPSVAIGYGGAMLAGLAATLWRAIGTRERGWWTLAALLLAALATSAVQVRGAYAGALLAAPGLAALVGAARLRGALPLAGAWAASAGMLYPVAAAALAPVRAAGGAAGGACASPALASALARLPVGEVMAPIDAGARLLAATPQRLVAAPYHRDGAGDLASYRFYAGSPVGAARIAARWRVDYALVCADMPGRAAPGTAAHALSAGPLPGWHAVATMADGARIDTPQPRLFVPPARR